MTTRVLVTVRHVGMARFNVHRCKLSSNTVFEYCHQAERVDIDISPVWRADIRYQPLWKCLH